MSVILLLILASLAVALTFLAAFIWAAHSGQFEDTCTPAMRILASEDLNPNSEASELETGRDAECQRRADSALLPTTDPIQH